MKNEIGYNFIYCESAKKIKQAWDRCYKSNQKTSHLRKFDLQNN